MEEAEAEDVEEVGAIVAEDVDGEEAEGEVMLQQSLLR